LGASLNGGSVAGLKGTAPVAKLGSVAANVSSSGTTVVNNLLGSGPAISVSSSTQLISLLNNTASGSGGTITITSTGSILPPTSTGAVPTLLGQTPAGRNPTTLVGTGSLPAQGVISLPPGH